MIHRSSRVVVTMAAFALGSSSFSLACGGGTDASLSSWADDDAGIPYVTVFDGSVPGPTIGGKPRGGTEAGAPGSTCPPETRHPSVCCQTAPDGTLSCGEWIVSGAGAGTCPDGYASYVDPSTCCQGSSCVPAGSTPAGDDDDEGDASAPWIDSGLGVSPGEPSASCPISCAPGGWNTPDGLGCCDVGDRGDVTCSEGSYPPVYEYPVSATFGPDAADGPLACPSDSFATPDGLGCCTFDAEGREICGEYGAASDLAPFAGDAGFRGPTMGVAYGYSCIGGGVCCPANALPTADGLGCCTVDDADFTLCIHYADPSTFDAGAGDGGGPLTGEPFFAGSIVPWPWGPQPECDSPVR